MCGISCAILKKNVLYCLTLINFYLRIKEFPGRAILYTNMFSVRTKAMNVRGQ